MSDLGPIKFILIGGVVLLAFLMGLGMFASGEGEKQRDLAREARQERQDMIKMAMDQAREAQNMARMHMEHNIRAIEEAEYDGVGYHGYEDTMTDAGADTEWETPSWDDVDTDAFTSASDWDPGSD